MCRPPVSDALSVYNDAGKVFNDIGDCSICGTRVRRNDTLVKFHGFSHVVQVYGVPSKGRHVFVYDQA